MHESYLVRSRLEPVIVKADNSFASLDYSFLTKTFASYSIPDANALKAARDILTHFVSSPLATWTSDQIGEAISSFDLLLSACNSTTKAELLRTIKGTAFFCYQSYTTEQNLANGLLTRAKSNMLELHAYNKKYEALIERGRENKNRLLNIKADEERLFELEREMAMLRTSKVENVRASSEFRDFASPQKAGQIFSFELLLIDEHVCFFLLPFILHRILHCCFQKLIGDFVL
ncbi:hypothetical protein M5689_003148 [Euphorbia peplus]|nr:hypothetical protein M5689_003148 [Euphorbia peplus]